MGDYTDNQKFYIIDPDELVSVDNDLNYNWIRADTRVRSLVEYQATSVSNITTSLVIEQGFKWYKKYSNSIFYSYDGQVYQDPNARVEAYKTDGLVFESGYSSNDNSTDRVSYMEHNGFIRFRGNVVLNNKDNDFPLNTVVNFLTMPESILPVRQRYFFVHGGVATGADFQTFRIFVPPKNSGDPRMEFIKYGANASSSGERYLSLNDIYYPINDTAGQ
ncbi:hypothetical protein [Streptomyces hebeiensis]